MTSNTAITSNDTAEATRSNATNDSNDVQRNASPALAAPALALNALLLEKGMRSLAPDKHSSRGPLSPG